jgi:hypothetical protein
MAVEEVQLMSLMDGMVVVYISYDRSDATIDEDIEAYRVVWDIPAGQTVRANIWRNTSGNIWRTADLTGQGEWGDTAPFGPVRKKDELRFELVPI